MTTVAIVEDSATFRSFLADLIDATPGHRCLCACGSAEEALVQIPRCQPDVVLMDIHLPGESGIVCTARLRHEIPQTQVIMLTVYKDIQMIFEALKAGACGYLLKRSKESEILEAIAELRSGGAADDVRDCADARKVLSGGPTQAKTEATDLSARENEILAQLAEGLTNKEIAAKLFIGVSTVRTHLLHIYEKLHVRSRTEAAAKFFRSRPANFPHASGPGHLKPVRWGNVTNERLPSPGSVLWVTDREFGYQVFRKGG